MTDELWRKAPKREYKARDPAITSAMMSRVRNKGSKAELILRREIWAGGGRYRLHDGRLPGKPDLVFYAARVAVFVDSDWWHGRILSEQGEDALRAHLRTERQDWWVEKFKRNVKRDQEVTRSLEALGWSVVRLWESDILKNVAPLAERVLRVLGRTGNLAE
jgi:DNA mismatch endonuclease (patch repair protein)